MKIRKAPFSLSLLLISIINSPAQSQLFEEVALPAVTTPGTDWGVAFRDVDADGWEDFFVTRSRGRNLLFRNLGNNHFSEIAQNLGLDFERNSGMPLWGDIDNDGLLDLYVADLEGANQLFRNLGNDRFDEITDAAGISGSVKTEAVGFTDFDLDGYIDLFVFNRAAQNAFYRNRGDGTFEDVIETAGTTGDVNALGMAFADYDNDGDQDLSLVYDGHRTNNLYRNNGDGTFTDVATDAGVAVRAEGMAPTFADFNNDGFLDFYITNLGKNLLFRNNGDGTFTDITDSAGVGDTGMGWGLLWLDYDNDGWQDLYIANASGFNYPPNPNVLYHNNGDETFTIVNQDDPTNSLFSSFGAACGDFNRDGYPDIFITNQGQRNQLFRNLGGSNHWLALKLVGTISNRDALGARVTVRAGDLVQYREVTSSNGWVSQNTSMLSFGLSQQSSVDTIEIMWPSGLVENFSQVAVDQFLEIKEGEGRVTSVHRSKDSSEIPDGFELHPSYPNPFHFVDRNNQNGSITIQYEIGGETVRPTKVSVYNLLGQRVKTLVEQSHAPGVYSVRWDARDDRQIDVSGGVYLVRFETEGLVFTRKLVILK